MAIASSETFGEQELKKPGESPALPRSIFGYNGWSDDPAPKKEFPDFKNLKLSIKYYFINLAGKNVIQQA